MTTGPRGDVWGTGSRWPGLPAWASVHVRRAFVLGIALGLAIAVTAIAVASGWALVVIPLWLAATALIWRWWWPALLAYIFLLPLSPDYVGVVFPPIFGLNLSRALSLLVLPGLLLALTADNRRLRTLAQPLPLALLVFWLAIGVLPLWSSGSVTVTSAIRDGLLDGLDFVLPCLVLLTGVQGPRQARQIVLALAAGALLLVALGAVELATGYNPYAGLQPVLPGSQDWPVLQQRAGLPRVEVGFGSPLSFGRYLAMLAPLVMWVSAGARTARQRWALAALAGCLATGVLLTLSASPAVVLLLGLLLGAVGAWRASTPSLLLTALGALIFIWLLPVSPQVREAQGAWLGLDTTVSAETRHNLSFRFVVLELARHGLQEAPLLGYGNFGSIPVLVPEQDIINTYVVYLLKNGLVGLAAFLGMFAAFFLTAWRALDDRGPSRRLAIVLGAVMLAQLAGFWSMSPAGPGERLFWVVLGLSGALCQSPAVVWIPAARPAPA